MKVKKALYVVLGCIGVVLGAVGAVMPILPAFPFLMLAAFCFARSSDRLDQRFKGTRVYKNDMENKNPYYADGNIPDEHWIFYDGKKRHCYRMCCAGMCLGISYFVFLLWC